MKRGGEDSMELLPEVILLDTIIQWDLKRVKHIFFSNLDYSSSFAFYLDDGRLRVQLHETNL